ncbi:MAG: ABC transporter substrate-binding protein [Burkholderiaceae bacterium]
MTKAIDGLSALLPTAALSNPIRHPARDSRIGFPPVMGGTAKPIRDFLRFEGAESIRVADTTLAVFNHQPAPLRMPKASHAVVVSAMFAALAFQMPSSHAADEGRTPGVTKSEIKIGQSAPYSGPASGYGVYGKAQQAFFRMLNDQGGINGRRVNLISLDNGYSPPKAIEQTRILVEEQGVLAEAGTLGTAPNTAIQRYLNAHKIPHLFPTTGGVRFNDPKQFPWTVPIYPSYVAQGKIFARYVLQKKPDARIGVLYENDDLGKDFFQGLKEGLGAKASSMLVKVESFELSDPTVDSQILSLKAAGVDTLFHFSTTKFAALGLRKVYDLGWKPLQFLASVGGSIGGTLAPVGLDKTVGVMTMQWEKVPGDPTWDESPDMKEYLAFLKKYMPEQDPRDATTVPAYINAWMIAYVLRQCGDDLTRENVLRIATHLKDVTPPMLMPGISLSNSPTDYTAYHRLALVRFDGKQWVGNELISLDDL